MDNKFIFFTNRDGLEVSKLLNISFASSWGWKQNDSFINKPTLINAYSEIQVLEADTNCLKYNILLVSDTINLADEETFCLIENYLSPSVKKIFVVFHENSFQNSKTFQYDILERYCLEKNIAFHFVRESHLISSIVFRELKKILESENEVERSQIINDLQEKFPIQIPVLELFKHLSILSRKLITEARQKPFEEELSFYDETNICLWESLPLRENGEKWVDSFRKDNFKTIFNLFEKELVKPKLNQQWKF